LCVCVCVCVCERLCVGEREWVRKRKRSVCLFARERERRLVWVCVCVCGAKKFHMTNSKKKKNSKKKWEQQFKNANRSIRFDFHHFIKCVENGKKFMWYTRADCCNWIKWWCQTMQYKNINDTKWHLRIKKRLPMYQRVERLCVCERERERVGYFLHLLQVQIWSFGSNDKIFVIT